MVFTERRSDGTKRSLPCLPQLKCEVRFIGQYQPGFVVLETKAGITEIQGFRFNLGLGPRAPTVVEFTLSTDGFPSFQGQRTIDVQLEPPHPEVDRRDFVRNLNYGSATLTVLDDSSNVGVSVLRSGDPVTEGGTAEFVIRTEGRTVVPVTVNYTVVAGSASAADFSGGTLPPGGSRTIPAGENQMSSPIRISTVQDSLNEGDETFSVELSIPAGEGVATLTGGTVTEMIRDDDPIEVVIRPPGSAATVDEGGQVIFPLAFSGGTPTADVEITYSTLGSKVFPNDFTAVAGGTPLRAPLRPPLLNFFHTATFTPDQVENSSPLTVFTYDDDLNEADETFTIAFDSVTSAGRVNVAATGALTATITDNDPVVVAFAPQTTPVTVTEGSSAVFRHAFTGGTPTENIAVDYRITAAAGSGVTPNDFAVLVDNVPVPLNSLTGLSATFRFTRIEPGTALTVLINDDADSEDDEVFTFEIESATTAGSATLETTTTATATIAASDPVTVAIGAPTVATVSEGPDARVAFPITFGGGIPTSDVTVNYTLSGTGITASDFAEESGGMRGPLTTALTAQFQTFIPADIRDARMPNAASLVLSVLLNDDNDNEGDETFAVDLDTPSIGGPGAISRGSATMATAMIRDDAGDAITVALVAQGTPVPEVPEGDAVGLRLTITGGRPTRDVVVTYRISGAAGSGITAGDFAEGPMGMATARTSLTGLSQMFTPTAILASRVTGAAPLELPVPTYDDTAPEAAETFTVTLERSGATSAGTVTAMRMPIASATITDNEPTAVAIGQPTPATVTEGASASSFAFPLTFTGRTPTADVTVSYTLSGSGIEAGDFTGATLTNGQIRGSMVFTPAQIASNAPLTIAIKDDPNPELAEEFTVTLVSTTGPPRVNPAAGQTTARATIIDNDPTAVAIGQPMPATVTEGASQSSFVFPLRFLGVLPTGDVTVSYSISGAAGVDDLSTTDNGPALSSLNLSRVFAATAIAGDRDQTLTLFVRDDIESELTEAFTVTLNPAITSGLASEQTRAMGTILDDDGVRLRVEPEPPSTTSLPEGGVFRFRIVASREATAAEPIRGRYRTRAGTAGAGDFTPTPEGGTPFAIPADAAQTGVFELQIADDSEVEADTETFTIELEATSPADAVVRATTVTIQENDLRLTLSGPGGMVAEATPEQMATFTVAREGATSPAVTVAYEVSGVEARNFRHTGGGVGDADNPLRGSVVLNAGQASATFDLTIIDDAESEPAQTLVVALLTGDVTGLPQGGTVVPPTTGSTQATVTIAASDRVELVLERPGPVGTFVAAGGAVRESGGTATYRVRLGPDSDPLSQALTVSWSVCVTGDDCPDLTSPAEAADFSAATTLPAGTVTIAVGQSASPTFAVPVLQDDAVEGDERFVVQAEATTAANVQVEATPLTTVIVDDDARVAVSTDRAVVTEGDTATFTFTRSGVLDREVTVGYSVAGADAPGVDADDFQIGSLSVVIPAMRASATRDITLVDDGVTGEPDETLQVEITSVAFAPGTGSGAVTGVGAAAEIKVIEGVRITIAPVSTDPVVEGAAFEFHIEASRAVPAAVSGTYGTMTGTAGAGDFTEISGAAFTIPANGTQAGPFSVQTTDDSTIDDDRETFTVGLTLTSPPARTTAAAAVTVAIEENDLRLTLSGPGEGQTEITEASGGVATFTVARAGATRSAVTVPYEVSGAGIDQRDFDHPMDAVVDRDTPLRGSVTLPAGQASTSFALTITDDAEAEGNETLEVRLLPELVTGVAGAVEFAAAADGPPRLTILEDDVGIRVSAPSGPAGEGSTAVFTVTREGDLRPEVVLTYSIGGDGIDAADYEDLTDTEPLGTITLGEEQASAEIRIRIVPDGVSEPDEMLRVTVAEGRPPALSPGGKFEIVTAVAEVRIPRLEITVALSGPAEVPEGETAVFAVSLGLEPRGSVTTSEVRIAYTLGAPEMDTAQRGADYASSSTGRGTLRIPAGSSDGVIEVPVLRDGLLEAVEDFRLTLNPENSEGGGGSIRFADVRQLAVRILDNADQEARREQRTRAMLAATHRAAAQMATDVISNRFSHRNVRAQASASPTGSRAQRGVAERSLAVDVNAQHEPSPDALQPPSDPAAKRGPQARAEGPGAQRGVASRSRAESCSGRERTAEALARCASARSRSAAERSHTAREERAVSLRLHAGERWRKHKRRRTESSSGRERTAKASRPVRSAVEAEALRRASTAPDARAPGSSFATGALSTALRLTGLPTGSAAGTDAALSDPESAALLAGIDVPVRPFETDPYTVGSSGAPSTDASATDLDAVDPRLPSFAELLRGGHQFELSGEQAGLGGFGEGLSVWGAGTFQSLAGEPELDGRRLDYQGESFGIFLGADKRLALSGDGSELLAGAALGWTRGDLDYRDEALEVFELEGRFESKLWSIHPYASLRFSPRAQLWLIAGYGWGDVKIEERETREGERTATRRVETDATLWMVSAGAEGSVPLGSEASLLTARLQGTRTGGELDSARFGDGARLRGTRARTWRVAGELEVSHRFAFAEGGQFRPFATLRVRGDAGDDRSDDWEFAVDLGGGAELLWPERGLSLGLEGTAQLNQPQEYQEHRVTVDLSYDLAGDGRGLTVAVGSTLEGSGRLGDRVDGRRSGLSAAGAFATDPYAPGGASFGALRPGSTGRDYAAGRELGALRHSLQGEIGYGLAVLPFWRPGLLTPYARFELAGRGASAYATGLRFEAAGGTRLGLELGVDFDRHTGGAGTTAPDLQFLLTGELKF